MGCSSKDNVPVPTKLAGDEPSEKVTPEIDPEVLLTRLLKQSPLEPLGDIPIPEDNPMKPEVIELGRTLFFDPRLSGNNEVSCATCHDPNLGYGDDRPL